MSSGRHDRTHRYRRDRRGSSRPVGQGITFAKRGLTFLILDVDERIGDHWRQRWDSLKLYSPAKYDSLPGMRFPGPSAHWPTAREMADYLEAYARHFHLPVRSGVRVERVEPVGGGFVVSTSGGEHIAARQVIIATGPFRHKNVPEFAGALNPSVRQLHSHDYRNPAQFDDGAVLVVGLSHSGADIAYEAANAGHRTILSGRSHGQMPIRVTDTKRAMLGWPVVEFLFGARRSRSARRSGGGCGPRSARPAVRSCGSACGDLDRAGVERHDDKTVGVRDGRPMLADGTVLDVANVDLGDRLPARLRLRRGADRRRGRLAGRGPRRQSDGARPVLPRRPVPVRLHVDARGRRGPRREVRRRTGRRTRSGQRRSERSQRRRPPDSRPQAGSGRSAGPT